MLPRDKHFHETTNAIGLAAGTPPDWEGAFEFSQSNLDSPMQGFGEDINTPTNTALVGLRISDRPRVWVNWKALETRTNVIMLRDILERRLIWPLLWANTDLEWIFCRHQLARRITLRRTPHPASFRFSMRASPFLSWELRNGTLVFKNPANEAVMTTLAPSALDAKERIIPCTFVQDADILVNGTFLPTFRITPNSAELATATYPVTID
jgi:hypothetical protein